MPLGSSKLGLYRNHLGTSGNAFVRQLTVTPTITSYDSNATYGPGYKNKIIYSITSNLANAELNYSLVNASNSMFANGSISGNIILDSNGNANLSYDMNVWANYSNINTVFYLDLISPNSNLSLATSSNITLSQANTFTATSANASTLNNHTLHIFDSYETAANGSYSNAKIWDDMVVTSTGDSDDPFNFVTAIIVGGGGAGGKSKFSSNFFFGNTSCSGGGGAGGEVIYYKAPGNVYSTGNISITLGNGGQAEYTSAGNLSTTPLAKGGNTTFGFHETQGSLTAYGGAGGHTIINNPSNSSQGLPAYQFKKGVGGFAFISGGIFGNTIDTPLGGSAAGGVGLPADASQANIELPSSDPAFLQSIPTANLGLIGLTQSNITNIGPSSTIYSRKAPAGVGGLSSQRGSSGSGGTNFHHPMGAPQGGGNVFVAALTGGNVTSWNNTSQSYVNLSNTSGIAVPQPVEQAQDPETAGNVSYWYVSGGGASAQKGGGNSIGGVDYDYIAGMALTNGAGGTLIGHANTDVSFSVEPGARNVSRNSGLPQYHGIRGGGGSGGLFATNNNGTHGGEGIIFVYYPTEYMSFNHS